MRLIDADALLEKVQFRNSIDDHITEAIAGCVKLTRRIIENCPTIDAVPVVRCGKCERRDKCSDLTDTVYCLWYMETMYKDDFCSYGKRKDGDT